jgi:phage/plasmid primase-like uncharacterized protein
MSYNTARQRATADARSLTHALGGRWYGAYGAAACPVCQRERRRDQNALTISNSRDGRRLLLSCKKSNCGFTDILAAAGVAAVRGASSPPAVPRREVVQHDDARRMVDRARQLWCEASPSIAGTPAAAYLEHRGIRHDRLPPHMGDRWPPGLRWHERISALLVAVHDSDGEVRAIQRIFLHRSGAPRTRDGRKVKLSLGPIAGGAATLGWLPDPRGRWAIAEGAETALAFSALSAMPAWASLGASNMPRVAPPVWAQQVVICADHDEAGLRAAQETARRLRERGLSVRILTPAAVKADAADVLREVAS